MTELSKSDAYRKLRIAVANENDPDVLEYLNRINERIGEFMSNTKSNLDENCGEGRSLNNQYINFESAVRRQAEYIIPEWEGQRRFTYRLHGLETPFPI